VIVYGIDPGNTTGLAIFMHGILTELRSMEPPELHEEIKRVRPSLVCYEESRLIKRIFRVDIRMPPEAVAAKARSVGMVDGRCADIVSVCKALGIPVQPVSAKEKGAKLDSATFKSVTGWAKASNQHGRDAAMVAWRFRNQKA
jgi:predicted RNase H-like nuclease (RuvC/YqgF family)